MEVVVGPGIDAVAVTRTVTERVAALASSLERQGHTPAQVQAFLKRCLFTMFVEDLGLLASSPFKALLQSLSSSEELAPRLSELWRALAGERVLRFSGGLFESPGVLPLDRGQLSLLLGAAKAPWRRVEPAIFGTLLERALDPEERHRLGAHYTPRAYIERLVIPTVIEPLREVWTARFTAAAALARRGSHEAAADAVRTFHRHLCEVTVLDPACGSGNFLYVTLEHLKGLEEEVLDALSRFGGDARAGVTVAPHQLRGIEINPRAATLAELVLWIGYLQWHARTRGRGMLGALLPEKSAHIECRDAVLESEGAELVLDEAGKPKRRWDGKTVKAHPATGKEVPDERATVPMLRYLGPRPAAWPKADFIIGNPPFLGTRRMRLALGDGYVEALTRAAPRVPENADFVMYWWDRAAEEVRAGRARRFGFITTNSIVQTFNRETVRRHLEARAPLSLLFAVPDHPWVDSRDGAAVRVAMTVGAAGTRSGTLLRVADEQPGAGSEVAVTLSEPQVGRITEDLRVGLSPAAAVPLRANAELSFWGVKFYGEGFILTQEEEREFKEAQGGRSLARPFVSGRDLTQRNRRLFVLDCDGLEVAELAERYPASHQRLLETVSPVRAHNPRSFKRERWWIFGENQPGMRRAVKGLRRYIATTETARHRVFQFLDAEVLAEGTVAVIALEDALFLGVLSSRVHGVWALAAGGRLGVGNDPRYNKSRCFEPFPFPDCSQELARRIRDVAERLDEHRRQQLAAHPELTVTDIYNVLAKLEAGRALTAAEQRVHENALGAVLRALHEELDARVFEAYGLSPQVSEHELLETLVRLNRERAHEESQGRLRHLRPELQALGD